MGFICVKRSVHGHLQWRDYGEKLDDKIFHADIVMGPLRTNTVIILDVTIFQILR